MGEKQLWQLARLQITWQQPLLDTEKRYWRPNVLRGYFILHNASLKHNAWQFKVCQKCDVQLGFATPPRMEPWLICIKAKNKAPSFGPTWKFKDQYHFFFCADDKFKCIMGNKWPHDLDKLSIPLVWHVFEETNLTLEEVHHLEDVRFSLVVQKMILCHIGFLEDLK